MSGAEARRASARAASGLPQVAGAKVAGYVCALIILNSGDDPLVHAWHRVIETVLGIAVAWLLSLVPRLVEFKNPIGPEKGS